jgi:hypothetical protein
MFVFDDFGSCVTPPRMLATVDSDIVSRLKCRANRRSHCLVIDTNLPPSKLSGSTAPTSTITRLSNSYVRSPAHSSPLPVLHPHTQPGRRPAAKSTPRPVRPVLPDSVRRTSTMIHSRCRNPLLQRRQTTDSDEEQLLLHPTGMLI